MVTMVQYSAHGQIKEIDGLLLRTSENGQSHFAKQGELFNQGDMLTVLAGDAFIQLGSRPIVKVTDFYSIPVNPDSEAVISSETTDEQKLIEERLEAGDDISDILASLDAPTAGEAIPQSGGADFFIQQPMFSLGAVSAGYETQTRDFSNESFNEEILFYQQSGEDGSATSINQASATILQPPTIEMETDSLITFSRSGSASNPYGSSEVAEYLLTKAIDGKAVTEVPVNGVDLANIAMRIDTNVTVSFIKEGAGYNNTVGYYLFDPSTGNILSGSENSGLLWINASQSGGNLNTQPFGNNYLTQYEDFTIENVPEGTAVGFFLIGDAFDYLSNSEKDALKTYDDIYALNEHLQLEVNNGNAQVTFNDGVNTIQHDGRGLYFSHDDSLSSDGITHTLSGVSFDDNISESYRGKLIVGFEDLRGGGDRDYEDIIFSIDFDDKLAEILGDSRPIIRSISVADDALLASLTLVATNLNDGDEISFKDNNNTFTVLGDNGLITVEHDGMDYQFDYSTSTSGDEITYSFLAQGTNNSTYAPIEVYELLATSLHFKPSLDHDTDGVRQFSGNVIDENGLVSNFDIVTYTVEVEDYVQIDVAESAGMLNLNAGDDTLLIANENVSLDDQSEFEGGSGLDTIKLDGYGDMVFDAAFFKEHFNGGWERIDITGEGSAENAITLDAIAVQSLLDASEKSLTITVNGNEEPVLQIVGDNLDKVTLNNAEEVTNPGTEGKLFQFNGEPGMPGMYVQIISAEGAGEDLPIIETPNA